MVDGATQAQGAGGRLPFSPQLLTRASHPGGWNHAHAIALPARLALLRMRMAVVVLVVADIVLAAC
jgi:hypothetical protein